MAGVPWGWYDVIDLTDAGAGRVRWGGEMSQISKKKLDGVGLVDIRPPTKKPHHFVRKKEKKLTCNILHVTHHTWHETCDMLWGRTFSHFSILALTVWDLWYFSFLWFRGKGLFTHCTDGLNDWNNDKPLCRTALATQGMLNINI